MRNRRLSELILPLLIFVAMYFFMDGALWVEGIYFDLNIRISAMNVGLAPVHRIIAGAFLTLAAIARAWKHPLFNPRYRQWLQTTPWTAKQPLPLGPVYIQWFDALFVFIVTCIAWATSAFSPAVALSIYSMSYVTIAACVLVFTERNAVVPLAFGGALFVFLIPSPVGMLIAALSLFAAANFFLNRSLRSFPWQLPQAARIGPGGLFIALGPKIPMNRLWTSEGIILSLLAGCWVFATAHLKQFQETPAGSIGAIVVIAGILGFARWILYNTNGTATISLLGRIATGHLLIPGHDKILIAPAAAVILAATVPGLLHRIGCPPPVWLGATAALVTAALLCIGPTLSDWRLTGVGRMPRNESVQKYIRV